MKDIFLRRASLDDAELLFSWANDIDVRRNAFRQQEILWDEHVKWLKGKLQDENCRIYIGYITAEMMADMTYMSEKPIGQIRLDSSDGTSEIDYSVVSAFRGRGYGTRLLEEAMRLAADGCRKFSACVKKSNPASMRVFEKCGFAMTQDRGDYVVLERECAKTADARRPSVVICTQKSWNIANAEKLRQQYEGKYDVHVITDKADLTTQTLQAVRPEYVFFPHWSYLIPEEIFGSYRCVVFHMTDLPYGRGGSPLQNLIVRGFTRTKLSALRVDQGIDTGDIYMKEDLELRGTADEILRRASDLIFRKMIPDLLANHPQPVPQRGEAVVFRRRKPEDGRLLPEMDEKTIYDYIRMLDGEGYPGAFVELGDYRLRFYEADCADGTVTARVRFEKRGK